MYIDTHCHLQFPQFSIDLKTVIGNAKKAGVKQFIVPGVDEISSQKAIALALSQPGIIFASIGYHPYETPHNPSLSFLESLLQPQTSNPKLQTIVAIGEIGLDYHLFKGEKAAGKKSAQKYLFSEQLHLALKYNLPVIMHCRDGASDAPPAFDGGAYTDFFDVLDSLPTLPRGVIHCFSGKREELRLTRDRNLFVGLDGNLTYSKSLQSISKQIPLEMLLLETDAPYLTPIPHRGARNEPKYLPLTAGIFANIKQIPTPDVAIATTQNARSLFAIPAL